MCSIEPLSNPFVPQPFGKKLVIHFIHPLLLRFDPAKINYFMSIHKKLSKKDYPNRIKTTYL